MTLLWQDVQETSSPTDRQPTTAYKIRLGGDGYYNHHTMLQFDSVLVNDDGDDVRYMLVTDDKISSMLSENVLTPTAARNLRRISDGRDPRCPVCERVSGGDDVDE